VAVVLAAVGVNGNFSDGRHDDDDDVK